MIIGKCKKSKNFNKIFKVRQYEDSFYSKTLYSPRVSNCWCFNDINEQNRSGTSY